jgi:nucleoporin NUP82
MSSVTCSAKSIHQHSVLIPPTKEEEWELVPCGSDVEIPAKRGRVVMRDKDLLVVIGNEIRMTTVSGGDEWQTKEGRVGGYKVGQSLAFGFTSKAILTVRMQILRSPYLRFQIETLCPSPSGKLLAVVGQKQLVIIVLPKSSGQASGEVSCASVTFLDNASTQS